MIYMMTAIDTANACKSINGWKISASFSVGGFEWLAFSKEQPGKMIIISSQKTTIVDCNNGKIVECNIAFDETELIAYCDRLPDEKLSIAGEYGGTLPSISGKGEKIIINTTDDHIMRIVFVKNMISRTLIYHSYNAYICGFSYDGDYFVLADDGGILILKRQTK